MHEIPVECVLARLLLSREKILLKDLCDLCDEMEDKLSGVVCHVTDATIRKIVSKFSMLFTWDGSTIRRMKKWKHTYVEFWFDHKIPSEVRSQVIHHLDLLSLQ